MRRNVVASVLFTLFGGPGIVLLLVPWAITRLRIPADEPGAQRAAAALLVALGLAPLLESIVRFVRVGRGSLVPTVPPERLVASGLYRYVRNPMYLVVVAALAGEALLFRSRGILVECAVVWAFFHLFVMSYEEPRMARSYPAEYALYRSHVPRWLPRLRPWRAPEP